MRHMLTARRAAWVAGAALPALAAVLIASPAQGATTAAAPPRLSQHTAGHSLVYPQPHASQTGQTQGRADETQLTIDNFTFQPKSITVPAGTTLTWTNHDDIPHTVTASDRSFTSGALDSDDTFSYEFDTPGTYSYFCALHPKMTGEIVVE